MKSYSHLLPNEASLQDMLKEIGISSLDDLYSDIPAEYVLKAPVDVPGPLTQMEVERHMAQKLASVSSHPESPCFLGGGVWPHYIPAAVGLIASRSEFYTAYTPYQPEISQGVLQALFEYQSMVCDLTGTDAANASMYDWPTAAAEAARMAVRVSRRKDVLVASSAGFERRKVMETYLSAIGSRVRQVPFDGRTGLTDVAEMERLMSEDVAAVYVEQPNFFGAVETSVREMADMVHSKGSLFIVGVEPTSLGLLRPPGEYGADLVVGEGQPLGIPMNYGGPSLGIFAARGDLAFIRQMPGRIIGQTTEKGTDRKGYVMVLQSREQHIRREKATSNICTNQALMAVMAAAYLALLGPDGLRRLSRTITSNAHHVAKRIGEGGRYAAPFFDSEFYCDFTFSARGRVAKGSEIHSALASRGVHGALPMGWFYPELEDVALMSVTEAHVASDVDRLLSALAEAP
ncbi:MAG: aminomethyl-transferring glycine dehydrogenase subunit GcvPA [Nitrososphaerota archaeon]|nr:aminomethyl-transferring glycine dehydrogenase subunit GcvPA [Nitrososphaerota archaeon]MDG6939981.1 aminomethyl-transferring glycine dehydrogenase subunit GcvPA [Nitrososphaerota archaeon]